MASPKCVVCEEELSNWSGNIMVHKNHYPDTIDRLVIMCKNCTSELDKRGPGRQWHNLWELSWIKESYLDLEREIFKDLTHENSRWTLSALKDFNNLGRILNGKKPKEDDYEE
ncbi:hypothetical protein ACFCP7_28595 [Paenibacillus elgii]